mmetsp:Transcript_10709/g.31238  ORF Transcript_10709/g.31238 Transcript_10709/m.31238 type:complete len:180 (+) Transcript_10709:323-862(+)|eukprot:CAMPEP_0172368872 /NCGR_PEP_ID=MMETSP1060-20121228/29613_1 /TAXON_ID=37318 /ORGANISM="Pseudo-nitzschia pungens, Strain cf. cingulata" /LENGTH=179 /DNA_ID=CAMNT_0013093609 /DNA_START=247 /DNA_END=786 /DNA_ORIENTATION=-
MADSTSQPPLYAKYPISSQWEFTLKNGESVKGQIYCTDPDSGLVVIQDDQNGIRMISVSSIDTESREAADGKKSTIENNNFDTVHSKKTLEEREKRAIRLAQESLKHLNPKAPPKGQLVFDRLLKACNEVVWKNDSIVVLDSIVVDPPYTQADCKILKPARKQGSLDRVQKIVSSITSS